MASKVFGHVPKARPQATIMGLVRHATNLSSALFSTLQTFAQRINTSLPVDGTEAMTGPLELLSVTVAELGSDWPASSYTGSLVFVTDEIGGATPAFSDGTNWRRTHDRAIVS